MDEQTLALIRTYQQIVAHQEQYIAGVELFIDALLYAFLSYCLFNLIFDEWNTMTTYARQLCRRLRRRK